MIVDFYCLHPGVKRLREDLAHCIREKHRVEQEQRVLNRLHQVIQSRIEANQYQDMNLNKMIAQAMKDGVTDMDEVSLAKSEAMIRYILKHLKLMLSTKKRNVSRFDRKWNSLEQGVSQESMQTSSMEGDDDELMTVSISAITTDPITKKQIKNPVKNSDCGHVYDKDTILELLRSNPNTRYECLCLSYINNFFSIYLSQVPLPRMCQCQANHSRYIDSGRGAEKALGGSEEEKEEEYQRLIY